jgi:phage terminase large subunit-like protein
MRHSGKMQNAAPRQPESQHGRFSKDSLALWRREPSRFIEERLINPDSGRPFVLFQAEREFLQHAFVPDARGDLPYRDILWSCIKKSGKSTFGALCMLYTVICLGGRHAEAYVIANDYDQSTSRIFTSAARIVDVSPLIAAKMTSDRITFTATGSFIQALASDYRGAAGVEPVFVIADELWGFTTEASQRLYEECCPTPTRHPSVRMVTSYAGFTAESVLLENLVKRGKSGQQIAPDLYVRPGMIAHISHGPIAPWQSDAWLEENRASIRPSAYLRQYCNQFTTSESAFIDIADWDACVDLQMKPIPSRPGLSVTAGLDLGLRHDSTALVAVAWEEDRLRIADHKVFVPKRGETLDVEKTAERAVLELNERFALRAVYYDPWQGIAMAQRLSRAGVPMIEWPQTPGNLGLMAGNLLDLITRKHIASYPSDELRNAVSKTIIVESERGMRLGKAKQSDRVDPVIALAMACVAAVNKGGEPGIFAYVKERAAMAARGEQPVDDMQMADTYHETLEEIRAIECNAKDCPKCGKPLGATKTLNSDGRYYHPGCCPKW